MRYREMNDALGEVLVCRETSDDEYDNDDPIDDASLDDWAYVILKQHEKRANEHRRMIRDAKRCPSYQIRRTSRLVTRFFDWTLREADVGLRSTQLAVLCAITNAPARECMQDVARRLWMHPSTLSRAADALEERGLVERLEAPWDR